MNFSPRHFFIGLLSASGLLALSSCQVYTAPTGPGAPGNAAGTAIQATEPTVVRGQLLQGTEAYIVVEARTRKILAQGGADRKRQVASLTKLATAIVALDWQKLTGVGLDQRMIVPPTAAPEIMGGANPLGLRPGDQISLRDALYASLMASDNVSAETIADFIGRDLLGRRGLAGDPVDKFVEQMNALSERLGMRDTKFTNPHGLDHYRMKGHSTAADMARLAVHSADRPSLRFYTSQKSREVTLFRGGQTAERRQIRNTNELVGSKGVDGIKTGLTSLAGPCLLASASKDPVIDVDPQGRKRVTPRRLVVVVLGAQDRFGLTDYLMDQGWLQYDEWFAGGMRLQDQRELLPNF